MLIGNSRIRTGHLGNSVGLWLKHRGVIHKETLSPVHAKRSFPSGFVLHQRWALQTAHLTKNKPQDCFVTVWLCPMRLLFPLSFLLVRLLSSLAQSTQRKYPPVMRATLCSLPSPSATLHSAFLSNTIAPRLKQYMTKWYPLTIDTGNYIRITWAVCFGRASKACGIPTHAPKAVGSFSVLRHMATSKPVISY